MIKSGGASTEKISWSPKVRQSKIRQLYENDARGTVDEVLVEDVGLTLLQRCHSIWLVTRREVECPRCGAVFTLCEPGSWKMLPGLQSCPTPGCGWETIAEERMVSIDQLIHAFHIGLQTGRFNRSFANNLIEGSHDQMVVLLDGLSAGPGRVDKEQWRAEVKQMYNNRRGQN